MSKIPIVAFTLFAATALLPGNAFAQQTPAASTPSTPAPAAKTAPAAKPAQAPAASSTTPAAKKPATAAKPATPPVLKTQKDKASYAIGLNIGREVSKGLKRDSVDIDPGTLARGVKDALAGTKPLLTDDEVKTVITALTLELKKKENEKQALVGAANKKAGEDFLAANKLKDGVVPLPSGVQYKILKEGTGPKPAATDTVVCDYRGTLIDGTEFDSSYKRGKSATFPVDKVIPGWSEAVKLMPVGSKWQIVIPSDLAYGAQGTPGGPIGPNSTLVFDVELISIQPKADPSAATPATVPAARPDAQPKAQQPTQSGAQPPAPAPQPAAQQAQPQAQPQAKP